MIEACEWLVARNIALARDYGIGLETATSFDRDKGELSLFFPAGRVLTVGAQVIGTFDRTGGFLWAWNDPSDVADWRLEIELIRDLWAREPTVTAGGRTIDFDELTPLLALCCKTIGSQGLYRYDEAEAVRFLALRPKPGEKLPIRSDPAARMAVDGACDPLAGYEAAIPMVDGKKALLLSSLSEDDRPEPFLRFAVPDHDGGALCVIVRRGQRDAYRVRQAGTELKIVDHLPAWGSGFLWPGYEAKAGQETMDDLIGQSMTGADGWITVKRIEGSDPRRAIAILRSADGRFRYDVLRWQRYYDPSPADLGPLEGGLWGGTPSGFYATAEDAERDAVAANPWVLA